mgnify:CR=1 FL=1
MEELTVPAFLVRTMGLPPLAEPPAPIPGGVICALSGARIDAGYPLGAAVTAATGAVLDLLPAFPHGWMSEDAARAMKGIRNVGGIAAFEDGMCYRPLVSRDSAQAQARPCWSDLIREIGASRRGQRAVLIMATDFKKRVWNRARVTTVGANTLVYVYDPPRSAATLLSVDWSRLVEALDVYEALYDAGYAKAHIEESLLRDFKRASANLVEALALEKRVSIWRGTPEFQIAAIAAQRREA